MTKAKPLYQLPQSVLLIINTIILLCGLLSRPVMARCLFELTIMCEGVTVSKGFNTLENFINQRGNSGLQALIPGYTETSAATATLNLRGLTATAMYPANLTDLNFRVPCSGTDETFRGATRDQSQQMLRNFLTGGGRGTLT